jgi:hypothetical protein
MVQMVQEAREAFPAGNAKSDIISASTDMGDSSGAGLSEAKTIPLDANVDDVLNNAVRVGPGLTLDATQNI